MTTARSANLEHDLVDWDTAYSTDTTETAATGYPGALPGPSVGSEPPLLAEPPARGAAGAEGDAEPAPEPMFANLQAWVSEFLAPLITVELSSGMRWCPQWWRHAEAIVRLEALWRSWEDLRLSDDSTAMSVWLRDHLDYHLTHLMEGNRSPFRQCSGEPGKGHRDDLRSLPIEPAPAGWFGDSGM